MPLWRAYVGPLDYFTVRALVTPGLGAPHNACTTEDRNPPFPYYPSGRAHGIVMEVDCYGVGDEHQTPTYLARLSPFRSAVGLVASSPTA